MHAGTRRQLVKDSIGWDVTNWSKCLTFWERHGSLPDAAEALEVGAGNNGGLTLWLASKGAHVVCSGLDQPSRASQAVHEHHGVSDQIEYRHLDVLEMDYEDCFDIVVFKSVLGSIGRNENIERSHRAIAAMHRALKPGGELWFAENCAGTRLHQQLRNRYGWGKRRRGWRYVAWHEVDSLMAPFVSCSNTTVGFVGVLGRTEQQRSALGHADSLLFDRLAPRPAKYILIGVARKARAAPRPAPAVEADWTVRTVGRGDLPAIARVHQAAFPSQTLSRLGRAAIRRYYEWRLLRRRDLVAVGAFRNGALVAFCFAEMVDGASRSFRVLSTGVYPRYERCGLERRMLDAFADVSAGRGLVK